MDKLRSGAVSLIASTVLFGCDDGRQGSGNDSPAATQREAPSAVGQNTSDSPTGSREGFPAVTGEDPRILVRDTELRVTPSAVLHVSELLGQVERLQEAPAWFDEPSSFRIRVERATSSMSGASLAALLNEYVFSYEGSPLSDISVEIRDGRIHQEATLDAIVSIPISMTARVEVTGEGSLLLIPEKMEAAGVPVTSLMDLLGVELEEVLDAEGSHGVRVMDNFMILDPSRLMPPPGLRGRAESVSLEGDRLHLTLVRSEGPPVSDHGLRPSEPDAPHYVFFQGGEVRFGKLTMHETDLQIMDDDPGDPFDFYPQRLHDQLVAGASFTMPDRGLLVKVPDYGDLAR